MQASFQIEFEYYNDEIDSGYAGLYQGTRIDIYNNIYINDGELNFEDYDYCCQVEPLNLGSIESSGLVAERLFVMFKDKAVKTLLTHDLGIKLPEFNP